MKALWISFVLVLTVAALWATYQLYRPEFVASPGPSTYIQINHQGAQDKTPPLLRIGTRDSLPPQPLFWINHLPAPLNLSFTENAVVDNAQFQDALTLTHGLKCQDQLTNTWTELTISVVTHGRPTFYCLLDREAATTYVFKLQSTTGIGDDTPIGSMAGFLSSRPGAADGSNARPPTQWTELRHNGGAEPNPALLFGTEKGLAEASSQNVGGGDVRLRLTAAQNQIMNLARMDAMCANDPSGAVFDDDFDIRSDGGQAPVCKTYGEYGCYYLNTLYSLSLPGHAIDGIENVRTLAARLGCRPEGWGVYTYVDIDGGSREQPSAPVVWLGTEKGLPPEQAGVTRVVLSDVQYRRLLDLMRSDNCNNVPTPEAPVRLTVTPYQDGLVQVDCTLNDASAQAFVASLTQLVEAPGQNASVGALQPIVASGQGASGASQGSP